MAKLPAAYERFQRIHRRAGRPTITREGPLDPKTRELVKLGMAIGGRLEGAVRSHARRAIEAGASPGEIAHLVSLAVTTVGFPTAVAAFTWVEDALKAEGARGNRNGNRKR